MHPIIKTIFKVFIAHIALLVPQLTINATEAESYYHIHPQWSPDGQQILLYQRLGSSMSASVLLFDLTKKTFVKLTDNENYDANPVWHPSGKSVMYTSARPDMRGKWQVYQLDLKSGKEQQLTFDKPRKGHAFWHPKENKIVYQQAIENADNKFMTDMFLFNLDTKVSEQLTDTVENEFHPKFSSNGQHIIYDAAVRSPGKIYQYDLTAKKSSTLIELPDDFTASVPAISNDGKKIAFSIGQVTKDNPYPSSNIAIASLGSNDYQLITQLPENISAGGPTWSPDGNQLAIHLVKNKDARVYIYNFKTKMLSPLHKSHAFSEL
jgi:Tol biopolymer transport system component